MRAVRVETSVGVLGSARSFIQASTFIRFSVFSMLSGALFFDPVTDLGTADSVTGNPAGARDKRFLIVKRTL